MEAAYAAIAGLSMRASPSTHPGVTHLRSVDVNGSGTINLAKLCLQLCIAQTHVPADRQTDTHTYTHTDRQTHTHRQTDRHTHRQTDRQTDRQIDRQTDKDIHK